MLSQQRSLKDLRHFGRAWRVAAVAAVVGCTSAPLFAAHSIFDDDWTPPTPTVASKPNQPLPPAPPALGPATKPAPEGSGPKIPGTLGGTSGGSSGGSSASDTSTASPTTPAVKTPKPKVTKSPKEEPDPQAEYESVFGAEGRKVAATPSTKDDAEFAKKLVEAARLVPETPKLQALLYEKAADFGAKDPAGYSLALESLDALRALRPQQSAALDDRSLAVSEKQYLATPAADRRALSDPYRTKLMQVAAVKAAEGRYDAALDLCRKATEVARNLGPDEVAEVSAVSKQIAERQRVEKRVADLKARVEGPGSRPTSPAVPAAPAAPSAPAPAGTIAAAAKELVELLAGALESPAKAKPYVTAAADPALAQCVDLALAPPADLDETKVLQLADWYKSLADKTDKSMPTIQANLLRRAAGAYGRFLSMHTSEDIAHLKAATTSQQIAAALEKSGKAAVQTTSLLSRIVPERHAVAGRWQFQQNVLVADASTIQRGATLMIPVVPKGNYEISAEFVSQDAAEIGFVLPVGDSSVNVMRLYTSTAVLYVNHTMDQFFLGQLPVLSTDHDHHVLYAKVLTKGEKAGVLVKLDGVEMGRWEGQTSDLSTVPAYETPDPRLPALCLWRGRAGFFNASLHMLSGTAARSDVDVRQGTVASAASGTNPRTGGTSGGTMTVGTTGSTGMTGTTTATGSRKPRVGQAGGVTGGVAGATGAGAGGGDPTALPADGSRPGDAQLQNTGSNGFASHDGVTLTFSELPGGRRTVAVTVADPSDEYKMVRVGFPHLMAYPDNLSTLRVNARDYQRMLALSKQTPRGYTDADAAEFLKLYDKWVTAPEAAKPAAEHALFAAIHKVGENHRKIAAAWVDYVRQNVSDGVYQAILKYGRFNYAE